ncbi:RNA polymerase subunit sigma-70 [Sphaerisporangium rufum]|nr:RNA polymerase subunit sigma-70 [Sphaerisporangium rufum]
MHPGRITSGATTGGPDPGDSAGFAGPGDGPEFAELLERHRRELRVHCYRMLGSFDEAEDLVQETFLRAWRGRATFQGRSTLRAWLYRIATNACLDFLDRDARRPHAADGADGAPAGPASPAEIGWLQPFPDRLLEPAAPDALAPETAVVARETIELAFLAAIQHLPPRRRAVLLLRDVLGWSAKETAAQLGTTVESVKSSLKRARATLRAHLPERRTEWAPSGEPSARERELLRRFMAAHERADPALLAELLSADARLTMPPLPFRFSGRAEIEAFAAHAFGPDSPLHGGRWRSLLTRANRQPAVAGYIRLPGDDRYRAQSLTVLRIEDGRIAEMTVFQPRLLAAFELPEVLPAGG